MGRACLPSCHHAKALLIVAVIAASVYAMIYLLEEYKFTYPKLTSSVEIGIFIVADEGVANTLDQHIVSLTCYARRHAYRLILIHPEQYPMCMYVAQSIYFQKHCLVLMYLTGNAQIQWLLVLDMDVLVMNISKKIESYLPNPPTESSMHLILYERFNGEIVAGNYLIHNDPWSYTFLSRWLQYERQTRHLKFHNHDNGALNLHLLGDMVGKVDQSAYDRCFRVYENITDHTMYHTYVGCCKCALDGRWEFDHVRILRRGHSFIRDTLGHGTNRRIWSPTDFLVYTHKENVSVYYSEQIDASKCVNSSWTLPIREEFTIRDYTVMKETIRKYDREAAAAYPQSVGLPDIGDCWPHCANTEARRKAFVKKVCSRNASWRSF